MNPKDYTGKEWGELLKQMTPRQLRNSVRSAYRKVAKKNVEVAQRYLAESDLGGDILALGKTIRPHIYSRGGGFLITVNARRGKANGKGEKGMYKTSRGAKKPILMWAEDGTEERQSGGNVNYVYTGNVKWGSRHGSAYKLRKKRLRSGGRKRGRMPAYKFLEKAEAEMTKVTEDSLLPEVEAAVIKATKKAGIA